MCTDALAAKRSPGRIARPIARIHQYYDARTKRDQHPQERHHESNHHHSIHEVESKNQSHEAGTTKIFAFTKTKFKIFLVLFSKPLLRTLILASFLQQKYAILRTKNEHDAAAALSISLASRKSICLKSINNCPTIPTP